ncbi:uncharacterized protein LOC109539296 [Dendroctonus ponderosae]|uniref:Uncharacterized protein n=1 Tax=Dendroctonus ponderosae TaxID=77166 RepID=U4UAP0_DENPD|nr:uncharacterized protein LOC109539296 [Dendroctonus ponderosae]ERL87025.1 hypothetical protein D910_04427 [Dendroctonus ponderosae]
MLIGEVTQSNRKVEKKNVEERIVVEGMTLFKKQKEEARRRKVAEQQEMREMMERYWPWERATDAKPRGLRNLRLEELFPNKDYQSAKRFVGTLDLGRPGCGAPNIRDGQKLIKTKEDPQLRFQLGSKDLRRAVDNSLRYKTNRQEQMEYKNALDRLVEEKKQKQLKEKLLEAENEQRNGWSSEDTLMNLEKAALAQKLKDKKNYENFKNTKVVPPNRVIKLDPIICPTNSSKKFVPPNKSRKLPQFSGNKENGVELVELLAKDRRTPIKIPLCSTDVTLHKDRETGKSCILSRKDSAYLKELTQQMVNKRQQVQKLKSVEEETSRRHFSTWESFWGKPGHGAPRSAVKKGSIERLLYPQMVPIGVA